MSPGRVLRGLVRGEELLEDLAAAGLLNAPSVQLGLAVGPAHLGEGAAAMDEEKRSHSKLTGKEAKQKVEAEIERDLRI